MSRNHKGGELDQGTLYAKMEVSHEIPVFN
jgi:hypothetical protein